MTAPVVPRRRGHDTMASVHLDALRAAAALIVFLAHARGMFLPPVRHFMGLATASAAAGRVSTAAPGSPPYLLPSSGHEAVILFFVLSGVLVGGSVLRDVADGRFTWRHYLLHRLTRLWVPLLPALVLGAVIDMVCSGLTPSLPVFLGNVFFLQDILVPTLGTNSPLWSLTFEWWYYAAFPLLVLGVWKGRGVIARLLCLAGMLAIGWLVGPIIALYFLIWIGGAAVTLVPRVLNASAVRVLLPLGAVILAAVGIAILKLGFMPPVSDFVLAILACGFCYVILNARQEAGDGFYRRAAQFGAGMSYTLYLVHFPVIYALNHLLAPGLRLQPGDPVTAYSGLVFTTMSLLVLAYAWAVSRLFEANTGRVQRWLSRVLPGHAVR